MSSKKDKPLYSQLFGTTLKNPYKASTKYIPKHPPTVARIENVPKFFNWGWWFLLTPWATSSIFARPGYHVKVATYFLLGQGLFLCLLKFDYQGTDVVDDATGNVVSETVMFGADEISSAMRLLTFVLSSYLSTMVSKYYSGIREKSRSMLYGASRVVDTLAMTIDYSHPNAKPFLASAYQVMTCIGHYSLVVAAQKSTSDSSYSQYYQLTKPQIKDRVFQFRGLDGDYWTGLPPKQVFHKLRLALLQSVRNQRKDKDGCFHEMSNDDFILLRQQMNDFSAGASSTSSSATSSKLPYAYVQLVTWATHLVLFIQVIAFFTVKAVDANKNGHCFGGLMFPCGSPEHHPMPPIAWWNFVMFNTYQIIMIYFILGCLEIYPALCDIWATGLNYENYFGIVDLICEPLLVQNGVAARGPQAMEDIVSAVVKQEKAAAEIIESLREA